MRHGALIVHIHLPDKVHSACYKLDTDVPTAVGEMYSWIDLQLGTFLLTYDSAELMRHV